MLCRILAGAYGFVKRAIPPQAPQLPCPTWYHLRVARLSEIRLGPNDDGRRVDRVARKALSHVPLSRVYSAIRNGEIRLNGRRVSGAERVKSGDTLDVHPLLLPPVDGESPGRENRPASRSIADRIVFESPHLLVVNKERGELVHGADSLAVSVADHLGQRDPQGISFVPGPVHRLDRNTTGLVVFGLSLRGSQEMSRAFRTRAVTKTYGAVLSGTVRGPQTWNSPVGRDRSTRISTAEGDGPGLSAETQVWPLTSAGGLTLAVVRILTGRTHQIRVHASAAGMPLLGDRKYGGPARNGGYILHAGALAVQRESDVLAFSRLWAPLPAASESAVRSLFGERGLRDLYSRFSGAAA
jgi:RluA family pseudouridine synthase